MALEIFDPKRVFFWGWTEPYNTLKVMSWGWFSKPLTDPEHPVLTALELLIEQFEDSKNLKSFLAILVAPMHEQQIQLENLQDLRYLNTATGESLNIIGRIVGQRNTGAWNDNIYRKWIYLKIFRNISRGEPETLIKVLKFITGSDRVRYIPAYPAGVELYFTPSLEPLPPDLQTIIEAIAPAGVRIGISIGGEGDFAFDGEGGYLPEPDTFGFGETGVGNENEGGKFVEII